jgi:hypothetical protein
VAIINQVWARDFGFKKLKPKFDIPIFPPGRELYRQKAYWGEIPSLNRDLLDSAF